jgi:hypothetical protein
VWLDRNSLPLHAKPNNNAQVFLHINYNPWTLFYIYIDNIFNKAMNNSDNIASNDSMRTGQRTGNSMDDSCHGLIRAILTPLRQSWHKALFLHYKPKCHGFNSRLGY